MRSMWRNPGIRIASMPGITWPRTTDSYASAFSGVVDPRQIPDRSSMLPLACLKTICQASPSTFDLVPDLWSQLARPSFGATDLTRTIHAVAQMGDVGPIDDPGLCQMPCLIEAFEEADTVPEMSGTTCSCSSSTSRPARHCRAMSAPPPIVT